VPGGLQLTNSTIPTTKGQLWGHPFLILILLLFFLFLPPSSFALWGGGGGGGGVCLSP